MSLLGGSWVVISRVISPLIWFITRAIPLITPRITTHEPPSGPRSPGADYAAAGKAEKILIRVHVCSPKGPKDPIIRCSSLGIVVM